MESKLDRLAVTVGDWSWRAAVLLLPWQTRWFVEGARIGNLVWEQNRMSFYASWVPLLLTVACADWIRRRRRDPHGAERGVWLFRLGVGGLLLASVFTLAPRASAQWWIEVGLLYAFFASLATLRVSARSLGAVACVSLLPHAILAIRQYAGQVVAGSKWLGIAMQDPKNPGVSVIEHDGYRLLRAYGGFPHPNILGGWLAVAVPLAVRFADIAVSRVRSYAWTVLAAIYAIALVLTFARGAWIACAVGLAFVGWTVIRHPKDRQVRYGLLALIALLLAVGAVTFREFDHVRARFRPELRLERRSLEERVGSLRDGLALLQERPWFGTGPNASILALAERAGWKPDDPRMIVFVPPHATPLLLVVETGVVGTLGVLLLVVFAWRKRRFPWERVGIAVAFLPILLADHFPWAFWSGKTLTALVLAFLLLPPDGLTNPDEAIRSDDGILGPSGGQDVANVAAGPSAFGGGGAGKDVALSVSDRFPESGIRLDDGARG